MKFNSQDFKKGQEKRLKENVFDVKMNRWRDLSEVVQNIQKGSALYY